MRSVSLLVLTLMLHIGVVVPPGYAQGDDFAFQHPGKYSLEQSSDPQNPIVVASPRFMISGFLGPGYGLRLPDGTQISNPREPDGTQMLWQYERYSSIVGGLKAGLNLLRVTFFKIGGADPETIRAIHVVYDPNLSLSGRQLLCTSNDDFSVLYDVASGQQVDVLDLANLCFWDDPRRGLAYDKQRKVMVQYDLIARRITDLEPKHDPIRYRRPYRFLDGGRRLFLTKPDQVYNLETGELISLPENYRAISQNARFVA